MAQTDLTVKGPDLFGSQIKESVAEELSQCICMIFQTVV